MPRDLRLEDQIDFLRDALDEAEAFPPSWREDGDVQYLYREGCLLVRSADVDPVLTGLVAVLRGEGEEGEEEEIRRSVQVEPVVQGVTRLRYRTREENDRPSVPDALTQLDDSLGIGTARPESVVFGCGHACPANEPEEVPQGTVDPFPAPQDDCRCHPSCDGKDVFVSVVDTGLLPNAAQDHYWMAGVEGDPENPFVQGSDIRAYAGHGTFVAGCVRLTAPKAAIYVERDLLDADANYEGDIVPELSDALDRSPDIVVFTFATHTRLNLSLPTFDALYETAIRPRKDLVILAPAGNDGRRDVMWPAAYPWVVSVGALSANWQSRASFSNFGGWVDVYAPGEDLVNAYATGDFVCQEAPNKGARRTYQGMAKWSGTSFSTPLVAGLIAARMSATGENGRQAADALLRLARSQTARGVGPVLLPGQACSDPRPRHRSPSGKDCPDW